MKTSLYFLTLFFLLFFANDGFACSCDFIADYGKSEQRLVREAIDKSKAVFSGEVTKITFSDAPEGEEPYFAIVHFKVTELWKGTANKEVIVYTANICCICGYQFKVGSKYLIYAYGEDKLGTNNCTRTKPLELANKDMKLLGKAKKSFVIEERKRKKDIN